MKPGDIVTPAIGGHGRRMRPSMYTDPVSYVFDCTMDDELAVGLVVGYFITPPPREAWARVIFPSVCGWVNVCELEVLIVETR